MRVLIIEDDPILHTAFARQFRRSGLTLLFVATPTEALAALEVGCFDAVLADYQLGKSDNGLDLLGEIRCRFPGVRRVLMTGGIVNEWKSRAHSALYKPFTTEELLDALAPHDGGEGRSHAA